MILAWFALNSEDQDLFDTIFEVYPYKANAMLPLCVGQDGINDIIITSTDKTVGSMLSIS